MMAALAGVLTNLITFRTNEAVINFYKRGQVENDPGLCRLSLMVGLMLDLLMGGILFLVVQIMAPTIAQVLLKEINSQAGVAIFSGIMLATFLRGTALGLLVAEERFRFINSLNVAEQMLKVVLLALAVYLGVELSFENIVWVMLIPSIFVTVVVYGFPLHKLFSNLRAVRIPRQHLGNYARFSLSTFLSSSLKAGNQHIDTVILGYLTNPTNVGIYNLFKQFLSPMSMLAGPYAAQIYPRFVQAMIENKAETIRDTVAHANNSLMKGFALLLFFIAPFLSLYSEWNNLNLTGEQYLAFGVMVIASFMAQQLWWGRPFSLATDPAITLYANVISIALTVSFVYIFTEELGLIGAPLGILVNYCGVSMYYRFMLWRFVNA